MLVVILGAAAAYGFARPTGSGSTINCERVDSDGYRVQHCNVNDGDRVEPRVSGSGGMRCSGVDVSHDFDYAVGF